MTDYISLAELKAHIVSGSTSPTWTASDDANLRLAISSASELVDQRFGPTFSAESDTRYFTPEWSDLCYVDDLLEVTTLKTDDDGDETYETTWTTSDYWLEPKNAQVGQNRTPYRQIRTKANGSYSFPVGFPYGVEIAGTWGYSESPPQAVKQAVLLMAHRVWKRREAIFGVSGTPALGVTTVIAKIAQDSDIQQLLLSVDRRGF